MRDGRPLLSSVTWRMRRKEHWALLGANGAGKTTLLQTVLGYLWPTRGSVRVLGQTYGQCDVREVRKRIGFVSSNMEGRLSSGQTAQNIVATGAEAAFAIYGELPADRRERARMLLRDFDMERFADQAYASLSQGERQKVMIARALMAEPHLLVLDEPCAGLDFPGRERLLHSLNRLCERENGPHLLYVTHYPEEILPGITHVAVLRAGAMIAAGAKRSVVTPGVLCAAYGLDVDVRWDRGVPLVRALHGEREG